VGVAGLVLAALVEEAVGLEPPAVGVDDEASVVSGGNPPRSSSARSNACTNPEPGEGSRRE
jgi:hypothetical protein